MAGEARLPAETEEGAMTDTGTKSTLQEDFRDIRLLALAIHAESKDAARQIAHQWIMDRGYPTYSIGWDALMAVFTAAYPVSLPKRGGTKR